MNNTNGADVMLQVEKQQLPTAFAHTVNIDSSADAFDPDGYSFEVVDKS
jgi:hypothetical protein